MLWGPLGCVGMRWRCPCYTGYFWNTLKPPGTYTTLYEPSWILLDVPCPQHLKCIAALMCSYPPLSYNTSSIGENCRRVQNRGEVSMFKYFLLRPNGSASLPWKLNATNFKGFQSIMNKMRSRPVSKPRNFARLQPWQKERLEIVFTSLTIDSVARYRKKLWKSSKGHRQFLRLKQHSPPLLSCLSYISGVLQKPPSPPYILYIWYCLIWSRLLQ